MIKNELLQMTEDIDPIDDRLMTLTLRGTVPHTFTNTYMYTAENHELNVERYTQLNAVKYVDEIIPYQTERDLEDMLNMLHIDVRILGEEYKDGKFTGRAICSSRGIELHFNKREHRFSSSDLRNRVKSC